ncbi:DMT family transporter [Paenibacillus yanchengensis]|uniref:DMT family transporter n=1 Tax=Paenibacillus yanchengensis TaxID=2035833 RepID=A0ABW4YQC0_9BACL
MRLKGILLLTGAIICEVFGTTMLKLTEGFTKITPSILFILGFTLAFGFLTISMKYIPLSFAYAIWSGAGTVLTAMIGFIIWSEPVNILTAMGIILIVGGIALLNQADRTAATVSSS